MTVFYYIARSIIVIRMIVQMINTDEIMNYGYAAPLWARPRALLGRLFPCSLYWSVFERWVHRCRRLLFVPSNAAFGIIHCNSREFLFGLVFHR